MSMLKYRLKIKSLNGLNFSMGGGGKKKPTFAKQPKPQRANSIKIPHAGPRVGIGNRTYLSVPQEIHFLSLLCWKTKTGKERRLKTAYAF